MKPTRCQFITRLTALTLLAALCTCVTAYLGCSLASPVTPNTVATNQPSTNQNTNSQQMTGGGSTAAPVTLRQSGTQPNEPPTTQPIR